MGNEVVWAQTWMVGARDGNSLTVFLSETVSLQKLQRASYICMRANGRALATLCGLPFRLFLCGAGGCVTLCQVGALCRMGIALVAGFSTSARLWGGFEPWNSKLPSRSWSGSLSESFSEIAGVS
jgi:hypothetical protein